MTNYVLGFLFDDKDCDRVVLIQKQKPKWQKGLWNGVGGKIEPGETPHDAMVREFQEETSVFCPAEAWHQAGTMQGSDWFIYIFWAVDEQGAKLAKTVTDEEVGLAYYGAIHGLGSGVIPNIRWLLPFLRDMINNPMRPQLLDARY